MCILNRVSFSFDSFRPINEQDGDEHDDDDDGAIADRGCSVEKCNVGRRSYKDYRTGDRQQSQCDGTTRHGQPTAEQDRHYCSRFQQFADRSTTAEGPDLWW